MNKLCGEMSLMAQFHHPNIVQCKGVCFLENQTMPVLLMERLMSSLHAYLLDPIRSNLALDRKVSILHDVASGLVYLHSHKPAIIHRDLTAKNVLLNSELRAKVGDFGNARIMDLDPEATPETFTSLPGTRDYMPPEAEGGSAKYDPSLDVFSFGHLSLFTIIQSPVYPLLPSTYTDAEGLHARSEVKRREQYLKRAEQLLGEKHSLVVLVEQCLHNYPAQRPQTAELVTRLQGTLGGADGTSHSQPDMMSLNQTASQQLNIHDLRVVKEELNNVRAQWYDIGVQLGVSVGTLKAIKEQYLNNPSDCLRETLTTWLKSYPPHPTWSKVVDALRSSTVGEARLAADLEQKYCSPRPVLPTPIPAHATTSQILTLGTIPHSIPITGDSTQPMTTPIQQPIVVTGPGATRLHTVEDQVQYLDSKFHSLAAKAHQEVNGRIEPSDFLSRVTYLPVSARTLHRSFIEEKLTNIPPPVTFENTWSILNLYWDFLNYELLEHVINKCGSEDLKQQMQDYVDELSTFKRITRLCDFIESWPCRDDGPPEGCFKRVVVKMQHEWSQCTLQDVESFKKALVHKFFLPEIDILLQKAERGCVRVTLLTSPSIATTLQQNLANTETEFFKKHSIISVTIDGQRIDVLECNTSLMTQSSKRVLACSLVPSKTTVVV